MTEQAPDSRSTPPRRRALKAAKLVLSDWTVMDCLVRDISETGARLEFSAPTDLPDKFRLLIVSSNLSPRRNASGNAASPPACTSLPGVPAPPRKL